MPRLIDADALKTSMDECIYSDRDRFSTGYAKSFIENAPTVDAVPVVRCGECRKCATDECYFFAHGDWGMSGPDWDFFCADGEHKGGDE